MIGEQATTWSGIDPHEAEARLLVLNGRLTENENVLAEQRRALGKKPDSFAFRLACESLELMQKHLQQERVAILRYRVNEALTVALNGEFYNRDGASIGHLGIFFLRLQKLYSSIAQALQSGPTMTGPLSYNIRSATHLQLANVFPSSFGMKMLVPTKPDLAGRSLAVDSLSNLMELLSPQQSDEALMRSSGELGPRTFSHFRHLACELLKSGADLVLEWTENTGQARVATFTANTAMQVTESLARVTHTGSKLVEMTGLLLGASLVRGRFEFLGDGVGLFDGNVVGDLDNDLTASFGKRCMATFGTTIIYNGATGETRTFYALTGIEERPSPPPPLSLHNDQAW